MFLLYTREGLNDQKVWTWSNELNKLTGDPVLVTDVKLVGEMSGMSKEEISEYVELLGYTPTKMEDIVKCAYDRLNLLTFYTGSEKECNAWTIEEGATVKEAAGVIHTDLEKNFITADVVKLEDLLACGGWSEAKERGKIRNHGKEYLIKDGDYVIILANS
jgi:ribosome-binding ATPase YchF (GTP1/OBG family)